MEVDEPGRDNAPGPRHDAVDRVRGRTGEAVPDGCYPVTIDQNVAVLDDPPLGIDGDNVHILDERCRHRTPSHGDRGRGIPSKLRALPTVDYIDYRTMCNSIPCTCSGLGSTRVQQGVAGEEGIIRSKITSRTRSE